MATPPRTVTFRQGAGRLSLDFIRTLRYRGTSGATEELPDPAALTAWINQFTSCEVTQRNRPTSAQLEEAQTLREAIYELLTAARTPAGARSSSARARETVNEAASRPVPAPALTPSGELHWQAGEPVAAALALLARDALDLATSAAISRVRNCANPSCAALFLDSSRPGTRRWCSMDICGNQSKKHTLRSKAHS